MIVGEMVKQHINEQYSPSHWCMMKMMQEAYKCLQFLMGSIFSSRIFFKVKRHSDFSPDPIKRARHGYICTNHVFEEI